MTTWKRSRSQSRNAAAPGFEVVDSEGAATLYRVTACD